MDTERVMTRDELVGLLDEYGFSGEQFDVDQGAGRQTMLNCKQCSGPGIGQLRPDDEPAVRAYIEAHGRTCWGRGA
jgi:hypothetical protein